MRFGIGGYAVIEHGGDELSDWQHIKAVLPTKRAAATYARREIGTFSLTDAIAQQRAWNEASGNHLNERRPYQWASMHALSSSVGYPRTSVKSGRRRLISTSASFRYAILRPKDGRRSMAKARSQDFSWCTLKHHDGAALRCSIWFI
jgi:hypothetical protein